MNTTSKYWYIDLPCYRLQTCIMGWKQKTPWTMCCSTRKRRRMKHFSFLKRRSQHLDSWTQWSWHAYVIALPLWCRFHQCYLNPSKSVVSGCISKTHVWMRKQKRKFIMQNELPCCHVAILYNWNCVSTAVLKNGGINSPR